MILRGGCHCGALTVEHETEIPLASIELRACQCTFCRRHGALNTSDPKGKMRIVAERAALVRYRFGLRTADFFVCSRCGVYIGCVLDDAFGSVNTRVLEEAAKLTWTPSAHDWSGEDTEGRIARRREHWTPATIEERS